MQDGRQSPLTKGAKAGEHNLGVLLSLAQFHYAWHGFALDNITDATQIEKNVSLDLLATAYHDISVT